MYSSFQEYLLYHQTLRCMLPRSADVDFLLFVLNLKNSLRTYPVKHLFKTEHLEAFCKPLGCSHFIDQEGYCFISRSFEQLERLIELDHSPIPHTLEFGLTLGYPKCCCEKIQKMGEARIDDYEMILKKRSFKGPYALIDPSLYRRGCAYISHVPCSETCQASLNIARISKEFLDAHQSTDIFRQWHSR